MSKNVEIENIVMADYLDRIGEGLILVSKEPLSYDWTPPELIGRGEELREMASMFLGIENHNVSCKAVVTGNVGSGKTVLTRRFCMDVSAKLEGRRKVSLLTSIVEITRPLPRFCSRSPFSGFWSS